MGTELIRSVTVQKNNVYLTSKSNNDDRPYRFWHCESLSEVYRKEGLPGLDREVICMLCEYAQTAAAKRFRQTERMLLDQKYTAMAQLCRKDTGELIQTSISTGRGDLA